MAKLTIGKLNVMLSANTASFTKGMRNAGKQVGGLKSKMAGFAARINPMSVGLAALGSSSVAAYSGLRLLMGQVNRGDQISKTATRIGIAASELSKLHHAAEKAGLSTSTLDMAMQRMVRRVAEAAKGSGEAVKALEELGLSAEFLNSQTPDKQLLIFADALREVETHSDRVRLAMKLFDSEGVALIQMLSGGSREIQKVTADAQRLGLQFDDISAYQMAQFNDSVTNLRGNMTGLFTQIANQFAPELSLFGKAAEQIAGPFTNAQIAAAGLSATLDVVLDNLANISFMTVGVSRAFASILSLNKEGIAQGVNEFKLGFSGNAGAGTVAARRALRDSTRATTAQQIQESGGVITQSSMPRSDMDYLIQGIGREIRSAGAYAP